MRQKSEAYHPRVDWIFSIVACVFYYAEWQILREDAEELAYQRCQMGRFNCRGLGFLFGKIG